MVEPWLEEAAATYNRSSEEKRDGYMALVLLPTSHLEKILQWAFEALPDEILIGFDPNHEAPISTHIIDTYGIVPTSDDNFFENGFAHCPNYDNWWRCDI